MHRSDPTPACTSCPGADDPGASRDSRRATVARADLVRLARLSRLAGLAALAGAIAACSGGGGGTDPGPPPPPAPAPTPVTLPAVTSVPTPVGYDANRLAAFDRLNEIRAAAGLGLLAQDVRLDQAAQAHAAWEVANDLYQHGEAAGTPGFTGESLYERALRQGYPVGPGSEVISAGHSPREAIDGLVNVLYHRQALLDFSPVDVGIGWSDSVSAHVWEPLVVDLTTPNDHSARAAGQTAQVSIGGLLAWPLDGASDVPTHMGAENPDPVPAVDSALLGTPASLTVDYWKMIAVSEFTMTDALSGSAVPASILTHDTDPNAVLPHSFVGLVPLQVLATNTTYRVHFAGIVSVAPGLDPTSVSRDWSFTTRGVD